MLVACGYGQGWELRRSSTIEDEEREFKAEENGEFKGQNEKGKKAGAETRRKIIENVDVKLFFCVFGSLWQDFQERARGNPRTIVSHIAECL